MPKIIRKLSARVDIRRAGGETLRGFLFLHSSVDSRPGPESILDLLNSSDRVLPFQLATEGSMLLISRRNIVWVAAGPGLDRQFICHNGIEFSREELVRIRFVDGGQVEGLLQMELPDDSSRASDFINSTEDFFPLFTSDCVLLINKTCVLDLLVYEDSPIPRLSDRADSLKP